MMYSGGDRQPRRYYGVFTSQAARLLTAWRTRLFQWGADFFFPHTCVLCGRVGEQPFVNTICELCRAGFSYIESPLCIRCGKQFISRAGSDHLCGACREHRIAYDMARSAAVFEGRLRRAVHLFKYRRQTILAPILGAIMAERADALLPGRQHDCIIPVPLHFARLRQRGYNQAALLARHAGALLGVPVIYGALRRVRHTAPQTEQQAPERKRNVAGAFDCRSGTLHRKRVLLIDDVYTSGSTVSECAAVMKKYGAQQIDVLTLARV